MSPCVTPVRVAGIDFGTTNSVIALAETAGDAQLVELAAPEGQSPVFRTALAFWQEDGARALSSAAGPWAIQEYLDFPQGSRFLQSFKSVAANANFDNANIFEKRLTFEELGQTFLRHILAHGGAALKQLPERIVVGRPVQFVGARPDNALAHKRYEAMFGMLGRDVHYVYEPLGAAYSFATRLTKAATLLVADFGGGTSDFSIVRVEAPGSAQRCTPLGSAGIGIAGDRFDFRIMDKVVLPFLGKGGSYRSFDKILEIPNGHFADFGDWSRLALMRNRRKLDELARLQRSAVDGDAIGRMISVIEEEQGYRLYDAVGRLKRALSTQDAADFRFDGTGLSLSSTVTRAEFESWIAPDLARMSETVNEALINAQTSAEQIDHVFLTGGSSLIPAVRQLFVDRFGENKIHSGEELTSIAHGLAMIGQDPDMASWTTTAEGATG